MNLLPDIQEPVTAICKELGIARTTVRKLEITPHEVMVELFRLNEHGAKYVDPETGEVATEKRQFVVHA